MVCRDPKEGDWPTDSVEADVRAIWDDARGDAARLSVAMLDGGITKVAQSFLRILATEDRKAVFMNRAAKKGSAISDQLLFLALVKEMGDALPNGLNEQCMSAVRWAQNEYTRLKAQAAQ